MANVVKKLADRITARKAAEVAKDAAATAAAQMTELGELYQGADADVRRIAAGAPALVDVERHSIALRLEAAERWWTGNSQAWIAQVGGGYEAPAPGAPRVLRAPKFPDVVVYFPPTLDLLCFLSVFYEDPHGWLERHPWPGGLPLADRPQALTEAETRRAVYEREHTEAADEWNGAGFPAKHLPHVTQRRAAARTRVEALEKDLRDFQSLNAGPIDHSDRGALAEQARLTARLEAAERAAKEDA